MKMLSIFQVVLSNWCSGVRLKAIFPAHPSPYGNVPKPPRQDLSQNEHKRLNVEEMWRHGVTLAPRPTLWHTIVVRRGAEEKGAHRKPQGTWTRNYTVIQTKEKRL